MKNRYKLITLLCMFISSVGYGEANLHQSSGHIQSMNECRTIMEKDESLCNQLGISLANRVTAEQPLPGLVFKVLWSFNDKFLLVNSHNQTNVYDGSGRYLYTISLGVNNGISMNPPMDIDETGRYFVTSDGKNIISLWDLKQAKLIGLYKSKHDVDTLSFGDRTYLNRSTILEDNPFNTASPKNYEMDYHPELIFINGIEDGNNYNISVLQTGKWNKDSLENITFKTIYTNSKIIEGANFITYSRPIGINYYPNMAEKMPMFSKPSFINYIVDDQNNFYQVSNTKSKFAVEKGGTVGTNLFLGNYLHIADHTRGKVMIAKSGGYKLIATPNYREINNHDLYAFGMLDGILLTKDIDPEKSNFKKTIELPFYLTTMSFSHNGDKLAVGSKGGALKIYNVSDTSKVEEIR